MSLTEPRFDPSRRAVCVGLAAAGGATLAGWVPTLHCQDAVDPRVSQIIATTIGVDMHSHRMELYVRPGTAARPDPWDVPGTQINFMSEIKSSGMSAFCYTDCVDFTVRNPQPGEWYESHRQGLDYLDRLLRHTGVRRVLSPAELRAAHGRKEAVIIHNSEGAQWIDGRLERVEEAYKRGLRQLQLVHAANDLTKPLGDTQGSQGQLGGLTPFGAEVVKECNRLGIAVDLAHGHESMVIAAAKVTQKPFVVSHTAMNSSVGGRLPQRLISRDYAKAVAGVGGVVGVWHLFPTLKAYVTAIKDMADNAGVDHTGIGTDTNYGPELGGPRGSSLGPVPNRMWPDQQAPFLYAVVGEMLAQGFRPDEISKIAGGNYVRVWDAVTRG